ncbi:MAG: endo-1,4-beta-xylanase [Phycisphaeraceae bacterium]|nr:endo-1,4-beta-xylanase [Phycisphaeraceae bacterium]
MQPSTRHAKLPVISRFLVLAATIVFTSGGRGQMLSGEWVNKTQKQIEALRMTSVRILVLDEKGQPAPLVNVQLTMLRHAFAWGVEMTGRDLDWADGRQTSLANERVWRCFSAVSLEHLGNWPAVEPKRGQRDFARVDRVLEWTRRHGLPVRWGQVISLDPQNLPAWAREMRGQPFADALEGHVRAVLLRYGREVGEFDLLADAPTYDVVGDRLGPGMNRMLFEDARFACPDARLSLGFVDCLRPDRLTIMVRYMTEAGQAFLDPRVVAVRTPVTDVVVQPQLARALEWIGQIGKPVIVTGLEVGGSSETAAAVSLETMLRTLFASPSIGGVYFAGVRQESLTVPNASLGNEFGQLTPAGQVVESLIRQLWWTRTTLRSDELGNVQTRVYAGWYDLTAQLPSGAVAQARVYIAPSNGQPTLRLAVLEPLRGITPPAANDAPAATPPPTASLEKLGD